MVSSTLFTHTTHSEPALDEGASGYMTFLSEFGIDHMPARITTAQTTEGGESALFRLSDSTGTVTFEPVPAPISHSSLSSTDAFLLDASSTAHAPAIYVWVGKGASLNEQRLVLQYAQQYLHNKRQADETVKVGVSIIRMKEGSESQDFLKTIDS